MSREIGIFEQQNVLSTIELEESTVLDEFKKSLLLKVYLEVEPLLNAILTHRYLSTNQQHLFLNHIKNNSSIYYYMGDKDIFIKLLNKITSKNAIQTIKELKKNIKEDQYPKDLKIPTETLKNLTLNLKEIYRLRYKALLLRYIDHIILLLSLKD